MGSETHLCLTRWQLLITLVVCLEYTTQEMLPFHSLARLRVFGKICRGLHLPRVLRYRRVPVQISTCLITQALCGCVRVTM